MEPLISIIVPVYNVVKYLSRCLDSILKQSWKNIEIILIDDGSSDGSGLICDEYKEKDLRISVIHQSNHGVSYARNRGLECCKGDFVAFVDADDWIDTNYCEDLLNIIIDTQADIACCSLIGTNDREEFNVDKQTLQTGECKQVVISDDTFDFFQWYSINAPFCKLIRYSLIEKCKNLRFDETLCVGEDLVFYINLMIQANKCVAEAKTMYHYFIREGSAMRTRDMKHLFSEVQAWEITCGLLHKEWASYRKASEKLLYYTYNLMNYASKQQLKLDKEQILFFKNILKSKQKYKYILGQGWKFDIQYFMLQINPRLYFKLVR